jgi:hypothetical protein
MEVQCGLLILRNTIYSEGIMMILMILRVFHVECHCYKLVRSISLVFVMWSKRNWGLD